MRLPFLKVNFFEGNQKSQPVLKKQAAIASPVVKEAAAVVKKEVAVAQPIEAPKETSTAKAVKDISSLCVAGTEIQSLIFAKAQFTKEQAVAWAEEHGFKSGVDEKKDTYRMRQHPHSRYVVNSFHITAFKGQLPEGVKVVVGCPNELKIKQEGKK